MAASSVFDQIIWQWAKRVGYDSVQLTMQPQVWCGLTWTTEVLDLRVRRHRPHDLIKHLSLRNPLALAASMGKPASAPCVVRQDNTSWRAFNLMMYCEGNVMERSARCLSDAATGKALRKFTIYSPVQPSSVRRVHQGAAAAARDVHARRIPSAVAVDREDRRVKGKHDLISVTVLFDALYISKIVKRHVCAVLAPHVKPKCGASFGGSAKEVLKELETGGSTPRCNAGKSEEADISSDDVTRI